MNDRNKFYSSLKLRSGIIIAFCKQEKISATKGCKLKKAALLRAVAYSSIGYLTPPTPHTHHISTSELILITIFYFACCFKRTRKSIKKRELPLCEHIMSNSEHKSEENS